MATETLTPMQAELLRRADDIFAAISSAVGKATDFVATQVPDIAMQYVAFGRAYLSVIMLVAFALLVLGGYLTVRLGFFNSLKLPNDTSDEWHNGRIVGFILGVIGGVAGVVIACINAKSALLVWFAPKVWLIMELADLIKRAHG